MKTQTLKAKYADDIFTDAPSARSRSRDMGLGGTIHVSEYDGQAVYMPAESHEAYLRYYEEIEQVKAPEQEDRAPMDRTEALRAIVSEVLKVSPEEQTVWGWAYVSTVNGELSKDHSGEFIRPDVLVKAATEFMMDVRVAKAMHQGNAVGEVVHSMPLTKDLGEALGVQSDYEGWIIAMKIHDPDVWSRVKSGELSAFSIGGRALGGATENE